MVIQSMCTTPTQDVAATVAQCISLAEAGCQLVRITAPGVKDAKALGPIRKEFSAAGFEHVPLVADIHFMPAAAMEAIEHVEKVRINPGNFADKKRFATIEYTDAEYQAELERVQERFAPLARRARELGRALRIGVNHGSLSDRIMNRFGDTPAGMVEAAMEFLRFAEAEDFRNSVISMKSSNPKVMVQAYRLLCARLEEHGHAYPLHLGVTEAGDGDDGRVAPLASAHCLRTALATPSESALPSRPRPRYPSPPHWPIAMPHHRSQPIHSAKRSSHTRPSTRTVTADAMLEIIRIPGQVDGADITLGGGQLPRVLTPPRPPQADAGTPPADAIVADEVPLDGIAIRADSGAAQPLAMIHLNAGDVAEIDDQPLWF